MSCVHWCIMIAWVRDPLYPSFYSLRGVEFTWKIELVRLYRTQTLSLLALFTRFGSISIFQTTLVMGYLARVFSRVGRLLVGPPVPFLRVHDMWYP
jgi:hypothetical protein